LWRDPSFLVCFVFAAVLYGAMFPFLWARATTALYQVFVIAYFFLLWFLVCAIVSIPIGMIRGYWQGRADSDRRDENPSERRRKADAAVRVSGRLVGRYLASRKRDPDA
jgi:hypothetical protein